jgi:hypothetical protein
VQIGKTVPLSSKKCTCKTSMDRCFVRSALVQKEQAIRTCLRGKCARESWVECGGQRERERSIGGDIERERASERESGRQREKEGERGGGGGGVSEGCVTFHACLRPPVSGKEDGIK